MRAYSIRGASKRGFAPLLKISSPSPSKERGTEGVRLPYEKRVP